MRYFMAEGVKCRQAVRWLTPNPPPGGPGTFLPAEASPSHSADAAAEGASGQQQQPELRIAWQYKKYEQQGQQQWGAGAGWGTGAAAGSTGASRSSAAASTSRSSGSSSSSSSRVVAAGVGREWCHSYDLTRSMGEQELEGSSMELLACSGPGAYAAADRLAAEFLTSLPATATATASTINAPALDQAQPAPGVAGGSARRPGSSVGRLVIESAGSLDWATGGDSDRGGGDGGGGTAAEVGLLRLLYNLRQRVQQSRCAVLVTVPAGLLSPGTAARLPHLADTVLSLETLADDMQLHKLLPDPASAVALLSVRKLCAAGMLGPRTPDGGQRLYVVRHRRRRLALGPVEVDPDAEDRLAEAAAKAAEVYGSRAAATGAGGGVEGGRAAEAVGLAAKVRKKSSVASVLCGGPPARDNKAFDF